MRADRVKERILIANFYLIGEPIFYLSYFLLKFCSLFQQLLVERQVGVFFIFKFFDDVLFADDSVCFQAFQSVVFAGY